MHFPGAGLADHLDDLGRGGAADDRVVDQDHALAVELGARRVVLQLHAEMANVVRGLDEGAADIVVADDAELEGHAALGGVADRRRHAGVGHRDHQVGVDVALAGELGADALPRLVDAGALDDAVGAREVDVLEDAEALVLRAERVVAVHAGVVDHDDLARLDVAHEVGADDVEAAGLGCQDVGVADLAQHQRADAVRIAHADQACRRKGHQRIGTLDLAHRADQPVDHAQAPAERHQVDDDLAVGGRLEQAAAADQVLPQLHRVGQVPVVAHGEAAGFELGEQRLRVAGDGGPGGGVAVVADRGVALEPLDHARVAEIVADVTQAPMRRELLAVEGDDARRLLAAVLLGVQPERGVRGGVGRAVDAEQRTLFVQLVVVEGAGREGHRRPWVCLPTGWIGSARRGRDAARHYSRGVLPGHRDSPAAGD